MALSATQKRILMIGVPVVAVVALWAALHRPAAAAAASPSSNAAGAAISPGGLANWESGVISQLDTWEQTHGATTPGTTTTTSSTTSTGSSSPAGTASPQQPTPDTGGTTAPLIGGGTVAVGTAVPGGASSAVALTAAAAHAEGVDYQVTPTVVAPQTQQSASIAIGTVRSDGGVYTVYRPNGTNTLGEVAAELYPTASPTVALQTLLHYNPELAGETASSAAPSAVALPEYPNQPVLNPSLYGQ